MSRPNHSRGAIGGPGPVEPGRPGPGWGRWTRLLHEAPRPTAVRRARGAAWLAVGTVCVGAFMGQLDASIVTIALPSIRDDLGGSLGAVEWVSLSYLLTLVAAVAPIGRLADSLGRKSLYVYGFVLFSSASLLCALAPNLALLDAARVLQGVGAALLQANSVALIATSVPRIMLGRAIGLQGAAQAVGLALGPSIGGVLLGVGDWRLLFAINVPVGVLGVISGLVLLPRSRNLHPRQPADWPGLVLFVPAVALALAGLSLAAHDTDLLLPIAAVAVGVALAAGFWRREKRVAGPLVDPALVAAHGVGSGLVAALLSYAVLFGVLFVVPFYLRGSAGASATKAGLELTVLPLMIGIVAPMAGSLGDRFGVRPVLRMGAGLFVLALGGMALTAADPLLLPVFLVVLGVGLGLFTPANNADVMRSAPADRAGGAAGLLNMTRGLGTAAGVAVAALIYARVPNSVTAMSAACVALTVLAVACLIVVTRATAPSRAA